MKNAIKKALRPVCRAGHWLAFLCERLYWKTGVDILPAKLKIAHIDLVLFCYCDDAVLKIIKESMN